MGLQSAEVLLKHYGKCSYIVVGVVMGGVWLQVGLKRNCWERGWRMLRVCVLRWEWTCLRGVGGTSWQRRGPLHMEGLRRERRQAQNVASAA